MTIYKQGRGLWLCACVMLATLSCSAVNRVFLLGGQSNMVGQGMNAELVLPYSTAQNDVYYWAGSWVPLSPGFGLSASQFGPEVAFGRAIKDALPDDAIYLVKYAANGTALYNDWKPTSGAQYVGFVDRANSALTALDNAGIDYEISGMLWMQGEADADEGEAASYEENLRIFIAAIRTQFSTPEMPFIIARVLDFYGTPTQSDMVRAAQVSVAETSSFVSWFDTDFYPVHAGGNAGHYNTQGQLELGRDYAVGNLEYITAPPLFRGRAVGLDFVLSWPVEQGRNYSLSRSSDLQEPFLPLQSNIPWPQSSYTDQTFQASEKGFYQLGMHEFPPVVTTAEMHATADLNELEGVNGDAFDGATVTIHSALHPISTTTDDWFSAPNTTELLFEDTPGIKYMEFNTLELLRLTNIIIRLAGDNQPGADDRVIRNLKLYASSTAAPIWGPYTLAFDIDINPEYTDTYGSPWVLVSVDLPNVEGRYFRIEFEQVDLGARIREIDAFGSVTEAPGPITSATFSGSNPVAIEGINGDAFDGATVTGYSALHPVSSTRDDWFTSPNTTELLFEDTSGIKFIEFNTAMAVALTNLTVHLSGDGGVGIDGRSVNNIKFYASTSAGTVMDNLSADIVVNPDYDGTYGSPYVEVKIDLNSVTGQYFRLEFNQPGNGARIREIDAFIE